MFEEGREKNFHFLCYYTIPLPDAVYVFPTNRPDQKSWIQRKLYHWDPHFKFPTRLISTIVLVIRCLYTFVILEFLIFKALNSKLRELADSLNILALSVNETENTFISAMEEFATITFDVWVVTTIISCITSLTYLFNILVCYRKHIKLLQSGKKHFLLPDPSTLTSSHSVVALGKYISWQVAYTIWGYLIMHLIQWVFVIILVYLFILPMKRGEWMNLLNNWGTTILSLVIITIIRQLQVVVAGRFFLQPKISPQDKQKPLALDNWRAFVNFNYFLFFHSVVVGLLSCLMRLFRSVILGAWLVGRLDRPLMPAGFESCDKGFCTWVEMLALDHYHTNPILGCFCYILHRANRERQEREAMAEVAIMDWDGSASQSPNFNQSYLGDIAVLRNASSIDQFENNKKDNKESNSLTQTSSNSHHIKNGNEGTATAISSIALKLNQYQGQFSEFIILSFLNTGIRQLYNC
ncbi:Stimulated by retinoic acid gene 6 protein-like [Varanus komodoensis]|nr:Stimulated by retinoic acid gene 6 protein-like [Varanus komodoensis]